MILNDTLGMMWNYAVVACCKVQFQHLFGGTGEDFENSRGGLQNTKHKW